MRRPFRSLQMLVVAATVTAVGCQSQTTTESETPSTSSDVATAPVAVAANRPTQAVEPVAKPVMPTVVMTEAQQATCLKRVGDVLPETKLGTLDGKEQSIAEALGDKLSVVLFWNSDDADFAAFLLEDMKSDIVKPYSKSGVELVAIHVGGDAEQVRKIVDHKPDGISTLHDKDGSLFAQVATEKLPRIYLVDRAGKILWFDIEYSRTTRRQLDQAIQVALDKAT